MSSAMFNAQAARPDHPRANQLIDTIIAARPDLACETFVVPGHGNSALTVMTAGEVFKSAGGDTLRRECAVLRHLQAQGDLAVDIPRVTWEADDGSIFGMTRLHGEPLGYGLLLGLGDDVARNLGDALGRFNARMAHALDEQARLDIGVPMPERVPWLITPDHLVDALSTPRAKAQLGHPAWSIAARLAEYHQRTYDPAAIDARVMSVHGDMHEQNILYNRETGRLSVIDIGGGDPVRVDHAFCLLRRYFTYSFTSAVARSFSAESGCPVSGAQIEAYYAMSALRHSLFAPNEGLGVFRDDCCRGLPGALDYLERAPVSAPVPSPVQHAKVAP